MNIAALFEESSKGKYWTDIANLLICHHPNNGFREYNSPETNSDASNNVSASFVSKISLLNDVERFNVRG